MPNWKNYTTKEIFDMECVTINKKKKTHTTSTKSLALLQKRYCKAYKFKYGISLKNISLNKRVMKFLSLHPNLKINASKTSLSFVKEG